MFEKEKTMNILTNYKGEYNNSNESCCIKCTGGENKTSKEIQLRTTDYKPDIFEVLSKKVVNKKDLNDMVTIPRNIFKGYLCFTVGTAVNAIASLLKNDKARKVMTIVGSLASIYGTFNFVKPYLIRNNELTKTEK